MFKSPGRVIYNVSDLEAAKVWYRQVLNSEPVFDSPFSVVFMIGEFALFLSAGSRLPSEGDDAVVYWYVDDVISCYQQLCALGAQPRTAPLTAGGTRSAAVTDPFGNVVGIISKVSVSEKTVERSPSETARGVAALRFLATLDERDEIRGRDYLAEVFILDKWKTAFRDAAQRHWLISTFFPPGMYLGHIARTAWFDQQVEQALKDRIPQIVFLGAGYDSRPYRFASLIKGTCIFELDAPPTQENKKSLLKQAGITIPEGLAFVPTNFVNDSLQDVLISAGFDREQRTLYVWEGVTYYLPAEAIDNTLRFIRENSPSGSAVCFDYAGTFDGMDEAYGVRESREFISVNSPGERMQFSIEREKIKSFLSVRGFAITEHLMPEELEKRYLTLKDGSAAGKMSAGSCYVRAALT